jgi:mannose-6-phosphate isomerase-like protein (cupin superfamily)
MNGVFLRETLANLEAEEKPVNLAAVDRKNAEHYTWGGRCDGWHLVKTPELSVILESMPPRSSEVRHFHQHSRQFFFVLEGELTLEVENRTFTLTPEQGLEIAPGQAHQAMNVSQADVRMIVVSQPHSHGDRVSA